MLPTNEEMIDDITRELRQYANETGHRVTIRQRRVNRLSPELPEAQNGAMNEENDNDMMNEDVNPNNPNEGHRDGSEEDGYEEPDEIVIDRDGHGEEHMCDECSDEETENDEAPDAIDETLLRVAEMGLTDEQLERRKVSSEELKAAGNNAFKEGRYEESAEKYTEGLKLCPLKYPRDRAILFNNRSAAKMKLAKYKEAVKDCKKSIELDDTYVKAYVRRAQSYEALDMFEPSLEDYKKVLELDPAHREASQALPRVQALVDQRNEVIKAEMLDKLKDLGNVILRPFGLSTDNFQMEQDPNTMGYKINFRQ